MLHVSSLLKKVQPEEQLTKISCSGLQLSIAAPAEHHARATAASCSLSNKETSGYPLLLYHSSSQTTPTAPCPYKSWPIPYFIPIHPDTFPSFQVFHLHQQSRPGTQFAPENQDSNSERTLPGGGSAPTVYMPMYMKYTTPDYNLNLITDGSLARVCGCGCTPPLYYRFGHRYYCLDILTIGILSYPYPVSRK